MKRYLVTTFVPVVNPADKQPPHKQLERHLNRDYDDSWQLASIVPTGDVWGMRFMLTFVGEDGDA